MLVEMVNRKIITKHLLEARWCYQKASAQGHYGSIKQLLTLDYQFKTADEWCTLARDYYLGRWGKAQDYTKVRACSEIALTLDAANDHALFNLGFLYGFGLGVDKDLEKAKDYHAKAKNHLGSILLLERLNLTTAAQWSQLGDDYYVGRNGQSKDYNKAFMCFQTAYLLDLNHLYALYSVGWQHQYGQGCSTSLLETKWCYEKASARGHYESLKQLFILNNSNLTTASQWFELGSDYYHARNNKQKDYKKSTICYERALFYNPRYMDAIWFLGYIHEHGQGTLINFNKAAEYYDLLRESPLPKYKQDLKRFERKRIEKAILQEGKDVDVRDENNQTALHRAAQIPILKSYARLRLLGANPKSMDKHLKTPIQYLSEKVLTNEDRCDKELLLKKTTALQNNLMKFIDYFYKSTPEIIATRIIFKGMSLDINGYNKQLAVLEELYDMPAIRPLFDLAKLAILGKHKLSQRPSVVNDNYDSDEDENEATTEVCYFNIIMDPQKETVEHIVSGGEEAYGIYWPTDQTRNTIFVAGGRPSPYPRATLIHELCHFIAQEVYGNHCFPYKEKDFVHKIEFTNITDQLKQQEAILDPILQGAFHPVYVKNEQIHCELIVRVPQLIVSKAEGLAILQEQAPFLLEYYTSTFLVDVQSHINHLQSKAFGHWSPQLFRPIKSSALYLNVSEVSDVKLELG
jgi:TPR repeat protein